MIRRYWDELQRLRESALSRAKQFLKSWNRQRTWSVVRGVGLVVGLVTAEFLFFHHALGLASEQLALFAKGYHAILTFGYRPLTPRYSAIVTLKPKPVSALGICAVRARINHVLDELRKYEPRAIVFNFTLDAARTLSCPVETNRLLDTVQKTCSRMPITFAYEIRGGRIVEFDSVEPLGKYCSDGYSNTKERLDIRELPLEYRIGPRAAASLSWAAAQLVDPEIQNHPRLDTRGRRSDQFYAAIFLEEEFSNYAISESELSSSTGVRDLNALFRGRVVVVGDESTFIETNAGPVRGYLLQASYIEALLDGRILKRVPWCIEILLSLLFWYAIESAVSPGRAAVRMMLGLICFAIFDVVAVHVFGYYSDFVLISLVGFFIWGVSHIPHSGGIRDASHLCGTDSGSQPDRGRQPACPSAEQ